jgi:hypothetical protein
VIIFYNFLKTLNESFKKLTIGINSLYIDAHAQQQKKKSNPNHLISQWKSYILLGYIFISLQLRSDNHLKI